MLAFCWSTTTCLSLCRVKASKKGSITWMHGGNSTKTFQYSSLDAHMLSWSVHCLTNWVGVGNWWLNLENGFRQRWRWWWWEWEWWEREWDRDWDWDWDRDCEWGWEWYLSPPHGFSSFSSHSLGAWLSTLYGLPESLLSYMGSARQRCLKCSTNTYISMPVWPQSLFLVYWSLDR